MESIRFVTILNKEYFHHINEDAFAYPMLIGFIVIILLVLLMMKYPKCLLAIGIMILTTFILAVSIGYFLALKSSRVVECAYTFRATSTALKEITQKYGPVTQNEDGTYTVLVKFE